MVQSIPVYFLSLSRDLLPVVVLLRMEGAFHSTKISGNLGSNSNGTQIFRRFVSKISVHFSRLSFFLEIWKFGKFPFPFGISTRFESDPVPLVVKAT